MVDYQDFGAYTALFLGLGALFVATMTLTNWFYSIPCAIGGIIAILSFAYHEKNNQLVRKLDSRTLPESAFARRANQFRKWIYTALKFDFAAVFAWLFLSLPAVINYTGGVDKLSFLGSFGIAVGYTLFALLMVKYILKDYEDKFDTIEDLGFTEDFV